MIIIRKIFLIFAPVRHELNNEERREAIQINTQYRLFFYSSPDETGIIVNALLFEISKHYE